MKVSKNTRIISHFILKRIAYSTTSQRYSCYKHVLLFIFNIGMQDSVLRIIQIFSSEN